MYRQNTSLFTNVAWFRQGIIQFYANVMYSLLLRKEWFENIPKSAKYFHIEFFKMITKVLKYPESRPFLFSCLLNFCFLLLAVTFTFLVRDRTAGCGRNCGDPSYVFRLFAFGTELQVPSSSGVFRILLEFVSKLLLTICQNRGFSSN